MRFRVVRPMRREGSRFPLYVRRIPEAVRAQLVGRTLHFPLGDSTHSLTVSARAQAIRFSLRTDDPVEVKARNAAADEYLERVLRALRDDATTALSNSQATALAGRLYRAWASGEGRERTLAVEQGPDGKMRVVPHDPEHDALHFEAALQRLVLIDTLSKHETLDLDQLPQPDGQPDSADLEVSLGPLVDRLLLAEGIRRADTASRGLLLRAFWRALRDALEVRKRNAEGDYSPDPKAGRFPAWAPPKAQERSVKGCSLTSLVEGWWLEAKARNLKPSTRESYSNSMKALIAFLGHDSIRVTVEDIRRFKDHRLATINPRSGRPISAKTVKDSDLSGLKTVFGWGVANGKMSSNPAQGV